jgi:hypothetical protein
MILGSRFGIFSLAHLDMRWENPIPNQRLAPRADEGGGRESIYGVRRECQFGSQRRRVQQTKRGSLRWAIVHVAGKFMSGQPTGISRRWSEQDSAECGANRR